VFWGAASRAGTYNLTTSGAANCDGGPSRALELVAADSGETWAVYPPDGYGAAILNGQADANYDTDQLGINTGVCIESGIAQPITFNGLQFENFGFVGIATLSTVIVTNNIFHHSYTHSILAYASSLIIYYGPGSIVSHNYIHDMNGNGISVVAGATNGGINNLSIDHNFSYNVCVTDSDCGAIQTADYAPNSSTNMTISYNYIRDVYTARGGVAVGGGGGGIGIYFDDSTTNVTAVGNIVTGLTGSCFLYHENANNVVTGNICDLSAGAANGTLVYVNQPKSIAGDLSRGQTGLIFRNNVIVCRSASGNCGNTTFQNYTSFSGTTANTADGPTNSNNT
jgi:hypothetical protein